MVDFLTRDPYQVGRDAGDARRQQQSDNAAMRDLHDLERAKTEATMRNDATLDRNIRQQVQGSPLREIGAGRAVASNQPASDMPASVYPREKPQPQRPGDVRRNVATAYVNTPGHAAQGAQMMMDQDAKDVAVFDQTMKYLAAGQPELARSYAQRFGEDIPPQIIGNVAAQREIADTWKQYSDIYKGRPRDLKNAMEIATKEIIGRHFTSGGGPANSFSYNGLPQPPEMSRTEKSTQPAAVQTAEWMVANGVARDAREAWSMLSTAKTNPYSRAQVVQRLYNAMVNDFSDTRSPQEKWTEAQSMVDQIAPMAAPPASAPPPANSAAAPAGQPQPAVRRYVPGRGFVQ